MINVEKEDLRLMLIASLRYALGRSSYIVSTALMWVQKYSDILTEEDKKTLREDIRFYKNHASLGDKNDIKMWDEITKLLKK